MATVGSRPRWHVSDDNWVFFCCWPTHILIFVSPFLEMISFVFALLFKAFVQQRKTLIDLLPYSNRPLALQGKQNVTSLYVWWKFPISYHCSSFHWWKFFLLWNFDPFLFHEQPLLNVDSNYPLLLLLFLSDPKNVKTLRPNQMSVICQCSNCYIPPSTINLPSSPIAIGIFTLGTTGEVNYLIRLVKSMNG